MYLRHNFPSRGVVEMAWNTADLHPGYIDEKVAMWESCPLSFFAHLDPDRRAHFVEILRRKYESELVSRYELPDAKW